MPLDAVFDLPLHLEHAHLAFHQREHLLQPVLGVRHLEQFLLVGQLHRQVRRHLVGQPARLCHLPDRRYRFRRDFAVQLHVAFELFLHGAHQRGDIAADGIALGNRLDRRLEILAAVMQLDQPRARFALDQHLHGAVRKFQELQNGRECPNGMQVAGIRIVDGRIALGDQHDLVLGLLDHLEGPDGLVAADKQRCDHIRENNDVP